jgi:membrane-associated phospholipid phosphatase
VVVATGNHYVLDVLAGICIALISLVLAYRYPRSRQYGRTGAARALLRPLRPAITPLRIFAGRWAGSDRNTGDERSTENDRAA